MKRKILGINTEFENLNIDYLDEYSFNDNVSFLDYDVVIIDTNYLISCYDDNKNGKYGNKVSLNEHNSNQIVEDFRRIKKQIEGLLEQGKNVYILMGKNDFCYIRTGEKRVTGTGKNSRTTNIIVEFDTYSFLPINLSVTHVYGEAFEACSKPPYSTFINNTKKMAQYASFFDTESINTIARIPKTENAVSAFYEMKNGKIVLLPLIYFEENYSSTKEWKKNGKIYIDELLKLDDNLRFPNDYIFPSWAENISILNERQEKEKLAQQLEKLNKIQNRTIEQKLNIHKIQQYKTLLTATGTTLEEITKKVISELGIKILDAERGRSDLIAEYKSIKIVSEIKGVSNSAAEKHAAQLEKWVAQYTEENEISPKGILIVNGYCDTPLFERTKDVFPHQMLRYSESRQHCLITTTQLLCLYIETQSDPSCLSERIDELLNTVGKYNRYLSPQDFFPITKN